MARRDYNDDKKKVSAKKDSNTIVVEAKDAKASPYDNMDKEKLIELLEKKDELLASREADVEKYKARAEACSVEYDKLLENSESVLEQNKKLEERNKILEKDQDAGLEQLEEELMASFTEELKQLKETHKAELDGQIKANNDKLAQKDADHSAAIAKLEEAHQEKLEELKATYEAEIDAKVEVATADLAEENKKLRSRIAELENMSLEGVAYQAMTSELTAFVKKEDTSFSKEASRLEEDFDAELESLIGTYQKSKKLLQKNHEQRLAVESERIINDSIAKVKIAQEARAKAEKKAQELREDKEYFAKLGARINEKEAEVKAEADNDLIEA